MNTVDAAWSARMRALRMELGLSQRKLAELSGVSTETVRAYEAARRHPSRRHLERLLAAMSVPGHVANDILEDAGFAPRRGSFPLEQFPNYYFDVAECEAYVQKSQWPEFVTNSAIEVVAVNRAAEALWQIDWEHEKRTRTRAQMNLLSVASDHHFTDLLLNWEECVGTIVSVLKSHPDREETLDAPSSYFAEVLAVFAQGDPAFLQRLAKIWESAPYLDAKCHWDYPVMWRHPDEGTMRFRAVVSTASEPDSLAFSSWIPIDAQSWTVLERVKARHFNDGRAGEHTGDGRSCCH